MAAFFSLGTPGSSGSQNPHNSNHSNNNNNNNNSSNLFEIYPNNNSSAQKGFELWQQYVQVHHHHHAPSKLLHLHQDHHHHHHTRGALLLGEHDHSPAPGWYNERLGVTRNTTNKHSGSGMNCQDCGNQAKKDCAHLRCRTCCKSRGFDCSTHVKSTWVPAAKRRERQQQLASQQPPRGGGGSGGEQCREMEVIMREKRSRAANSESGLEVSNFPAEVNTSALFRCVKVSAMDDPDEQFAYQTAINIGGHLFKGILYDQGPDQTRYSGLAVDTSSPAEHHLLTNTAAVTTAAGGSGGGGLIDPTTIYPASINAFMAGTQFFPPPRS